MLFACGKAGAILVPLNWRQTPAELAPILADCGARVLLHDAATARARRCARQVAARSRLIVRRLEKLIAAHGARAPARDTAWPTDRIWYLLYTSGTTGRPKAVIQTVGMALANYINVQQATGLTGADRTVNFLPLFHTAGINLHTLPLFLAGGTSTVLAKFEVDPLLDLIAEGRVTHPVRRARHLPGDQPVAALRRRRPHARAPLGLRRRAAAREPDPRVPGQGVPCATAWA